VSAEMGRTALSPPAELDAVERAILRTVTYAALFEAPLDLEELQRLLMDVPADRDDLRQRLERAPLSRFLVFRDGLVHPRGRDEWRALRVGRRQHTRALVERHRRALRLLARFPFVRLVALSGACAHGNAADDDVDVFLIVKRGRPWAVYLALVLLSRLLGVRRSLCLNYLVDEAELRLPERDLFTSAQIVGLRPLAGGDAYRAFVHANEEALACYPNFRARFATEWEPLPAAGGPRWLEALLEAGPAPLLEGLSRRLMGARLRRKGSGHPGVSLTPHRLKLHTDDHRPRFTVAFERALAAVDPSLAEAP
jgi:hypothetical protein